MKKLLPIALILFLTLSLIMPAGAEETEPGEEPIDKSKFQPSLVIESINAEEALAGGEFFISLVVRNWSNSPAFNVSVDLKVTDEDGMGPFSFKSGTPTLARIDGQESRTLTIGLSVSPEAVAKDYRLQISLRSGNAFFEPAPTAGAVITVPVKYDRTKPQLLVKSVQLDPRQPKNGEPFTAYVFLENLSRVEAHNVVATLDGQGNFTVLDVTNRKALRNPIAGGRTAPGLAFTLQANEPREGNTVQLNISYSYLGNREAEQTETITIPLGVMTGTRPQLEFSNFSARQVSSGREFVVSFTLTNTGQRDARNVKLTLDGKGSLLPMNGPSVNYLAPLAGGERRTLEYTLGLNRGDASVYPLDLTLEYGDPAGQKYTTTQTFGLSSGDIGASSGTPWVIISKYTLSPEQVFGGNVVTLSLDIENTNPKPVHNVKISLGVVRLESDRGDTVFSPIDSSNSFYLENIPGRGVVSKDIALFVDPNSSARTYIVPVTINYEDGSGNPLTAEEMVTIPVTQEARLQVIGIDVPPMAFVGQPVPIGAEFVNVGRVALGNFMVTLEGDFPKEMASYFVGNLEQGMSNYFQGMAIPQEEGLLEGTLVFTYLDNSNQEVRQEEHFSLMVESMQMPEDFGEFPPDKGGPGQWPGGTQPPGQPLPMGINLGLLGMMTVAGLVYLRKEKARQRSKEFFYE